MVPRSTAMLLNGKAGSSKFLNRGSIPLVATYFCIAVSPGTGIDMWRFRHLPVSKENQMQMTVTKALNGYFNKGADGKSLISPSEFLKELKALSAGEKHELAYLACQASGWTLVDNANKPLVQEFSA